MQKLDGVEWRRVEEMQQPLKLPGGAGSYQTMALSCAVLELREEVRKLRAELDELKGTNSS